MKAEIPLDDKHINLASAFGTGTGSVPGAPNPFLGLPSLSVPASNPTTRASTVLTTSKPPGIQKTLESEIMKKKQSLSLFGLKPLEIKTESMPPVQSSEVSNSNMPIFPELKSPNQVKTQHGKKKVIPAHRKK
jgi:hypothetical protein